MVLVRLTRRAIAEEKAALGLGLPRALHDLHHHGLRLDLEVPHHRVRHVLYQGTLLVEAASLDGIDVDFRHGSFSSGYGARCGRRSAASRSPGAPVHWWQTARGRLGAGGTVA